MVNAIVHRTDMSAKVTNHIIQNWELLAAKDDFPFNFGVSSLSWASGTYRRNLSGTGIHVPYALFIVTAANEGYIDIIDNRLFTTWFHDVSARLAGKPEYGTVRMDYLYLDRKTDNTYTMEYWFHKIDQTWATLSAIPDVSTLVTKFPRIVKSILANWAAADILKTELGQVEKGKIVEGVGNKFYTALQERYQRVIEIDQAFMVIEIDQAFISLKMARRGWNYRQRLNIPVNKWGD